MISYKCENCSELFCRRFTLELHQKQCHEQQSLENTYKCNQCVKQYNRIDNLVRHKKNYSQVTSNVDWKCDLCNKSFSEKHSYQRHKSGIYSEPGNAINQCDECEEVFCTGKLLKSHYNTLHRSYDCDACGQNFPLERSLKLHILTRNAVTCSECGKIMCNIPSLNSHKIQIHDCSECKVCGKTFQNIGMMSHVLWAHKSREI